MVLCCYLSIGFVRNPVTKWIGRRNVGTKDYAHVFVFLFSFLIYGSPKKPCVHILHFLVLTNTFS